MLITSSVAYNLHSASEKKHEQAMKDQIAADEKSCNADKAKTEKVSHDYQKTITDLRSDIDDAERVYGCSSIAVTGQSASGYNGSSGANQSVKKGLGGNQAIDGKRLVNLFAEGEKYRLQLLACQNFMNLIQGPEIAK